jgi:transcriptional regulator with XRE-family HTH domain
VGPALSPARDLNGLPERITAVRQKLGLAQRAFAARIGVSRNAVIRYEGGHGCPRADTLERIAQLGEVSVDWLLRGDRRPPEGPREWDDAVRLLSSPKTARSASWTSSRGSAAACSTSPRS